MWLLLGLLPLNVELLQWVPWRSAPHDGLPNHGLLAMSAALSLSHGVALLLLQGWFLATAGVATTEYVRASALGMALALSVGALCRVGRFDDALEATKDALSLRPSLLKPICIQAIAYRGLGLAQEADAARTRFK